MSSLSAKLLPIIFLVSTVTSSVSSAGGDWPQWRFDANRSAVSPHGLSDQLYLQWQRAFGELEPTWEDPVNRDRMPFGRVYEPVVAGTTLVFGSSRNDRVTALDTRTGQEKWRFYADGPVRFAPVVWDKKVYFVSDDGYLYCLKLETGRLLWKFRGGPSSLKALGNGRLISAWPARGGPVVKDATVYFAASIWPFMGVFIHAVDAETGKLVWTNDGAGSTYMNQPHSGSVSFGGVAPQGAIAAIGDRLIVPSGRAVPACLDRSSGKVLYYNLSGSPAYPGSDGVGGKYQGGSHVSAIGSFFLNHRGMNTILYDVKSGSMCHVWRGTTYPVLTAKTLYFSGSPISAYSLTNPTKTIRFPFVLGLEKRQITKLWEFEVDGSGALIRAGDRLYAGGDGVVSAIDVSHIEKPKLLWSAKVAGKVARLIAADDRLFAVTLDGRIFAFGAEKVSPKTFPRPRRIVQSGEPSAQVKQMISTASLSKGYCLAFGLGSGELVEQIARFSELDVIAVDPEAEKVAGLRRRLDDAGLYGKRISVHVGDVNSFNAPSYLAALTVCEDPKAAGLGKGGEFAEQLFKSIRPYGGTAWLATTGRKQYKSIARLIKKAGLSRVEVERSGDFAVILRVGSLAGSDDWTHQYGNIANTAKSDDELVKTPLGLLWFGGNSHHDVLPRHGHGPPEQVVGGRLFIQGMNMLSARDVYTGRVLWKRTFGSLGTKGVFYDGSYVDDPLDMSYNQVHIPGANARGTNYVVTPERIYLAIGGKCAVLDPATGKSLDTFGLPGLSREKKWAYLGVYKDILIGGAGFVPFSKKYDVKPGGIWENFDSSSCRELVVMNRFSGKVLWRRPAKQAFRHNSIVVGADKLFCIDALPEAIAKVLRRRGETAKYKPAVLALDIRTGREVWKEEEAAFGTWLAYSSEHDLLVQSGRKSRDALNDPTDRIMTLRGRDGEIVWNRQLDHSGPLMIHGESIFLNFEGGGKEIGAISLLSGQEKLRVHPLTGAKLPWGYKRKYGCNYVIGSEYLLTFRSGAAGFYDLDSDSGTGNLGGFKSGCTSNLIAADGVLNAPDYTRTCTCSYQNQTSLGLIHMPSVETWTTSSLEWTAGRVIRVGLNFGAPGDRLADNGTLWLDCPSVGGPSPDIPVEIEGKKLRYFRRHSSAVPRANLPWVAASGVEGAERITVTLDRESGVMRSYTVRLYFMEPTDISPGQRVFSLKLDGKVLVEDLDIAREAGGPSRAISREFKGVQLGGKTTLEFVRKRGEPLICGLEFAAEPAKSASSQ